MARIFAILVLLGLLGLIIFTPFGIVWSLNTLFLLEIPYNIQTYLSICILNLTFFWNGDKDSHPINQILKLFSKKEVQ